jgi:hypothetical protein
MSISILKLSRERVSQPDPAELKGCTMIFRKSNNPKDFLEHFKALEYPARYALQTWRVAL